MQEAEEQLQVLDESIIRLEKESDDEELLQGIFRAAHTLKGSSGSIKHTRMAELTHAMEGVLDEVRNRRLDVSAELVDALLESLDNLRLLRDEVLSMSIDEDIPVSELVTRLTGLNDRAGNPDAAAADDSAATEESAPAAAPPAAESRLKLTDDLLETVAQLQINGKRVVRVVAALTADSALPAARKLQLLTEAAQVGEVIISSPSMDEVMDESDELGMELLIATGGDDVEIHNVLRVILDVENLEILPFSVPVAEQETEIEVEAAAKSAPVGQSAAGPAPPTAEQSQKPAQRAARQTTTVRVDVERLDNLMNLVGEMVIDKTRLEQLGKDLSDRYSGDEHVGTLVDATTRMGRITNELQEEVMRSRMFPVENVFNRFPRMVRDLAKKAGKKVNFVVEGKETELDRSVVEEIGDPLIHLLRNAIDHGIEGVEDRAAAGKPEEGTITLTARHEENHIVMTVRDDGKGIDGATVRDKALSKGLLTPEAAERLKDSEAVDLIFLPGLSTAGSVSEVSGRGVGMDIVKNNIEKLNGTVSISTELGVGSVFEIKMPLTLAIIRALLVGLDSRVFAIPLVSVKETIESRAEDVQTVRGREVIRLRGEVLPLLRLAESYRGLKPPVFDDSAISNGEAATHSFVVAVRLGDRQVGLVVDKLLGEQEVVIKSLGEFIGDVEGIAGATILGDGSLAMIVEVNSLLRESLLAA